MMKKTAIALSVAALACGAQAAEVFKNADTAIEVNVDMQFYNVNVTDVGKPPSARQLHSKVLAPNFSSRPAR